MSFDHPRARVALQPMSLPNVIRFAGVSSRIGEMLVPLLRRRVQAMKDGHLPVDPTFVDKMLIAGLVRAHQRRGTLDELTALHDWFWSQQPAVEFHEFAERRFEGWFLGHHVAIVPQLRAALAAGDAPYGAFFEIGCGCGRVIEHLSRALPDIPRFIGLDLSAVQVARNRARFAALPIEFEAGDGLKWVAAHARPHWVYFTYGGVLEYFPRARVLELYSLLATRLAPSLVALVEPLSDDHDLEHDARSIVYGAENTFSHNYVAVLREAGFDVLHRSEQVVDRQRWLLMVARSPQASPQARH
jgi:SAM-dependent methyltransferase